MGSKFMYKGDPLRHRDNDPGYRVGWKAHYKFEKGHLDEELTYGEACKQAAALQAADKEDKIFYPELILYPTQH